LTNQFWNFTQDGVIGCFKQGNIEHFNVSEALKGGNLNSFNDFKKSRFALVLKSQENKEKVQPRTSKTIFKDLIKKPQHLGSLFVPSREGNTDSSIFLLLSIISNGTNNLTREIKKVTKENGDKF